MKKMNDKEIKKLMAHYKKNWKNLMALKKIGFSPYSHINMLWDDFFALKGSEHYDYLANIVDTNYSTMEKCLATIEELVNRGYYLKCSKISGIEDLIGFGVYVFLKDPIKVDLNDPYSIVEVSRKGCPIWID